MGCPAAGEEVRPPIDELFFPTGLTMAPDGSVLFVANANSDLRYDSGTITVIPLERVRDVVRGWVDGEQVAQGCSAVDETPAVLECDEASFIAADATVRTGNFATALAVQSLDSGLLRLFAAVRGDPSITYLDYDPQAGDLSCGGTGRAPLCDDDHRLSRLRGDLELPVLEREPFGLYVDPTGGYAVVTHLSNATVSLVEAPRDGAPPVISDELGGLFASQSSTIRGAVAVAGRRPGEEQTLLYVTSRSENRIQMLTVRRPPSGLPILVRSNFFFLDAVRSSIDTRAIAFTSDGGRAHFLGLSPATVQTYDTTLAEDGFPRNELVSAVEVCSEASTLVVAELGEGPRVYVSCYPSGQVWVIDPVASSLLAIIDVGRGPNSMVVAPEQQLLYVANFLEDTIAVVDLAPGAATENRLVMRLGRPRPLGDE